jgi:hypothetical protein
MVRPPLLRGEIRRKEDRGVFPVLENSKKYLSYRQKPYFNKKS